MDDQVRVVERLVGPSPDLDPLVSSVLQVLTVVVDPLHSPADHTALGNLGLPPGCKARDDDIASAVEERIRIHFTVLTSHVVEVLDGLLQVEPADA